MPTRSHSVLGENLQDTDKQSEIELYYELLSSGHSVGEIVESFDHLRRKSEHDNMTTAEHPSSRADRVDPDVRSEAAVMGVAPTISLSTPRLTASLEAEACRTEESQATEGTPLDEPESRDRKQFSGENFPGSASNTLPMHPVSGFNERSLSRDKQGAIERYYELFNSGQSVDDTVNNAAVCIRNESEDRDTAAANPPQWQTDQAVTNIAPEIALPGMQPKKSRRARDLSVLLSHEAESCRIEEVQAAESTSLNDLGFDNREQLLRESLPRSESDTVKSAGASTYTDRKKAIRSSDNKQLLFDKFPRIRRQTAFGVFSTVICASVAITGVSIMRGGRDAEPTSTHVQSDISSKTKADAIPASAAGASDIEDEKSQKQVVNADSSQAPKPSQPAKPDPVVPGASQSFAVGGHETGSAAQREAATPQQLNVGQVDAIQQSPAPATAPPDPAHERIPSVVQSLTATPKGSAEMAPHSDTGQPPETVPKDAPKATATVPTKNVSAVLPSRPRTAERRRAFTPRRDVGSRRHVRR